jgi:hypothetical protein
MTVSGNVSQAVANDDFEAFQKLANDADLEARGFRQPAEKDTATAKEDKPAAGKPEQSRESKAESASETGTEASREQKQKGVGSLPPSKMREELRKLQAEIAQLKAERAAPQREAEVETEPEAKADPDQLRAKPEPEDKTEKGESKYKTWKEYELDLLAWQEEKLLRAFEERTAKKQQEVTIEQSNKALEKAWSDRCDEVRKEHPDFDEAIADVVKLIGPGSIVDRWLLDSENGAKLLYYFSQHPEELRKFENMPNMRVAAPRELVRLESQLAAPPKESEPAREEPRTTKAPPPSREVGGRGNRLGDPVTQAVVNDDVGAYIEAANRRDIRAKFGDRAR